MKKGSRLRSVLVKIFKVVGLLFAALVVTLGVWSFIISRQPPVVIPTPKMPKPNGYDYIVKAGDTLVDVEGIRAALSEGGGGFSLRYKEKLLKRNARPLSLTREAFRYGYRCPPQRSVYDDRTPYYAKVRNLARLLVLDGQIKDATGHRGQAAQSYLDCLRLGSIVPRGGPVLELLVGIACESLGRRPLCGLADKLNAREARECCHRLEDIVANGVPFAESLEEDKWLMLSIGREVLPKRGWQGKVARFLYSVAPLFNERVVRNVCDLSLRRARLPYAVAKRQKPELPFNPFFRQLWQCTAGTDDGVRLTPVQNECQNLMLTGTLAVRAFWLDHDTYPSSLSDLVPDYLSNLPLDPFAVNEPLRYKPDGKKNVLYSVGPDGKDDGGKPIIDPKGKNNRQKHYVQEDSKGDIVAGVNIY